MKTIGIIGGGASGMMAAIAASVSCRNTQDNHVKIMVFDHKDILGKKILSTGNGRCNLSNEKMSAAYFRSDAPEQIQTVLDAFGVEDTVRFFEQLGLMIKSRNGYLYPRCDQAAAVRGILDAQLKKYGVEVYTDTHIQLVKRTEKGFEIRTENAKFRTDRLILATGGKASSVLGSDGSGYEFAQAFGHTVLAVVPALVQLKVSAHPLKKAAGVRTDGMVTAVIDGREVVSDSGELQITEYGISGIPVFQISRYLARALHKKQHAQVRIDFLPEKSKEAFYQYLLARREGRQTQKMSEFLKGIFHSKLIPELLKACQIREQRKVHELSDKEWKQLVYTCKQMTVEIQDTNGFDHAQVCAGGVNLSEIDCHTMQSKKIPGLYMTGELLDVDGICGGYNLQWAWATGWIAGKNSVNETLFQ